MKCFMSFPIYTRLCSASISPCDTYLAGGFEDSAARLWKLTPGSFPHVDNSDGPSVIKLSADYLNSDEDEEEDKKV